HPPHTEIYTLSLHDALPICYVHEVAQFFATGWLANYWRIDPMTDADFEWFEYKYPGWYDKYGAWWENYSRLSVANGHNPIAASRDRKSTRLNSSHLVISYAV